MFSLTAQFKPTGDQPEAIQSLVSGVKQNLKDQVLVGVTGSGKTFTMANVIQELQMPALIISHNKTLAGQLYQEMREFFPKNAISYFVSYYDYYQPEAYIPQTDTYIEKEAEINELIDKLRLRSTANILTRKDVVVVASVSCIYNIGAPQEYRKFTHTIKLGEASDWQAISLRLVELLYSRSEFEFKRGTFRVRGNYMDIYPPYEDHAVRLTSTGNVIRDITVFDPLTGRQIQSKESLEDGVIFYPAKHYLADPVAVKSAEKQIRHDLQVEHAKLKDAGKIIEAERLLRRTNYDLEMIKELGYVNGIENYSRYFDKRDPGAAPYSLLDYFKEAYGNNFLVFIDESHMTVPQIRGMFNGDHARKKTLIEFGFRLESAYDNRPLKFDEFYKIPEKIIYVSATPNQWELDKANEGGKNAVAQQLIRPTGIIDPKITIRPAKSEVMDLIEEIQKRTPNGEKILVTTLTKKIAEDLTTFLKEKNVRAEYLHSDIVTLERSTVLEKLRKNEFDVLIGVNLLREGIDLPEVTVVAILDADKEGFLRSKTALIQTMGRAARNIGGEVILYADVLTKSIKEAIAEIDRRRDYQIEYNKTHNIDPKTIYKPIREQIVNQIAEVDLLDKINNSNNSTYVSDIKPGGMTVYDRKKTIKKLEREMKHQAEMMNFELAILLRDKVKEFKDY